MTLCKWCNWEDLHRHGKAIIDEAREAPLIADPSK
jgi:hypothetical protein